MNPVEIDRDESIAVIRLNRPEVLNAINQAMWQGLLAAFDTVARDDTLRACIVTGAGRAFCSGADLKETAWHGETAEESYQRIDSHHQQLARAIIATPIPVIACINGYAMGGGVEIALAADIRIASENAQFGFPEAAIGRFITGGASLLLPRAVGLSQAKRLIFSGERVSARQALTLGLVDEVVSSHELLFKAGELAERIAANSSVSVRLMKKTLDKIALAELEAALTLETSALVETYSHSDIEAGRRAFTERRRTDFES